MISESVREILLEVNHIVVTYEERDWAGSRYRCPICERNDGRQHFISHADWCLITKARSVLKEEGMTDQELADDIFERNRLERQAYREAKRNGWKSVEAHQEAQRVVSMGASSGSRHYGSPTSRCSLCNLPWENCSGHKGGG